MKNKAQRRNVVGVVVILAIAVIGLLALGNNPASAVRLDTGDSADTLAAATQATTPEFVGTAMPSMLRMVFALIVVIGAIYGGLWLLKRSMNRGFARGGRTLEVLETTAVAPKKTISLVRVADKAVLVGVTDNGIAMLTELTAEQTKEIVAAQATPAADDGFSKALAAATGKLREFGLKRKQTALEADAR
jgi:flagellar protein FliO/FliZ